MTSQAAQRRVRVWDPACEDHEPDPGTPLAWCTARTHQPPLLCHNQSTQHKHYRTPNNLAFSSMFQQRARYLRSRISAPEEPYTKACWGKWFENSMLLTLESNFQQVQQRIGPINKLMAQPQQTDNGDEERAHWRRIRRKFQSRVYAALQRSSAPKVHDRFTEKLDRWKLHLPRHPLHNHLSVTQQTPNWQARCAHQRLKILARLTTPRVHAAVFGAMWNRWCTIKRYQGQGRCRLCQKRHTEDAIEHYPFCSVVRELAARRLRLCTTTHVNIHTFTFTNPLLRTKELLTRAALLICATY